MRLFKKRWHSIPVVLVAVLLALVLTTGGVLAAYTVWTNQVDVTVLESIEVANLNVDNPGLYGPGFPDYVYPNQDLGALNLNEKYLVHNVGPVDTDITITVSISGADLGQFDWIGLHVVRSNSGGEWGPLFSANPATDWWIWNSHITPTLVVQFTIGTVDYGVGASGPDSAYALVLVDGVVANDANPNNPIDFTVTVSR